MAWDNVWEKVFRENEWGKYPAESLIRFMARNFYKKERKKVRVLEVGCGTGANIWYLAKEKFDVYGMDGSRTAIKRAKRRLKDEFVKAHLTSGDIVKLPYETGYFDVVVDAECISCNSRNDARAILAEIKRVLKKDGLFYSRTFTDKMYIGHHFKKQNDLEYENISGGPLAGKGLVRLTTMKGIRDLYGKVFCIISIDKLEYSEYNRQFKVSEWVIISRKED